MSAHVAKLGVDTVAVGYGRRRLTAWTQTGPRTRNPSLGTRFCSVNLAYVLLPDSLRLEAVAPRNQASGRSHSTAVLAEVREAV